MALAKRGVPKHSRAARAMRVEGVPRSAELRRIDALPVRQLAGSIDVEGLSILLRAPKDMPGRCTGCAQAGCVDGDMTLFPDQAYALKELHDVGGAFVGMEVGSGKALITILAGTVVGAKRPLIMLPAGTREQTEDEVIPTMRRHWRVPANLMVGTYESLSRINGKAYLSDRMPDWVMADEAHMLQDEENSRGSKFSRHFKAFPDTHLGVFSGSFWDRSIKAFAWLIRLALAHYCPIPFDDDDVDKWCAATDSKIEPEARFSPGALLDFVKYLTDKERASPEAQNETSLARLCVGARMAVTPGVVFSTKRTTNIPIRIREFPVGTVPKPVVEAFEIMRQTWETPRGDVITDAVHLYRIVKQLSQGFFYRWVWPKDETGKEVPNRVWLDARKHWHKFVRNAIAYMRSMELDSYKEVENCCVRFEQYTLAKAMGMRDVMQQLADTPMLDSQAWRNWLMVRNQYIPVTETVWLDRWLVYRAAEYLSDNEPAICWVDSSAFGDELRKQGFRYYRGGENEIIYETVSCAAAFKAHGFGKNLQHFSKGLYIIPMTKGKDWEQGIGRYDRSGQKARTIELQVCLHSRELWSALWQAQRDAEFAQQGGRSPQRLCLAEITKQVSDLDFPMQCMGDDPLWMPNKKP